MSKDFSTEKSELLECERPWVFCVLMFIAGFYGCYTLIRFGVFCNAQTGNFVYMAMYTGQLEWAKAAYYLLPMIAYLMGAIIPEVFASKIKKLNLIRWDTFVMAFEIICVLVLSFLPLRADEHITMIAINFMCSIQFTTFRKANGRVMATTFCTAHWRQVGVSLVKAIKHKSREDLKNFLAHLIMVISFVIGGIVSSFITNNLQGTLLEAKSLLFTLIPLTVLFVDFLIADLIKEKGKLYIAPQGH